MTSSATDISQSLHLAPEIIENIVSYISAQRPTSLAQRDLWSCCLVSQAWYAGSVKLLYNAPIITGRNFSLLARTLSPPVTARVRKIGLEDFVHHVDMGRLAYESKRSVTARLIGRVKNSLETFVAPAISFSTLALAPLSRCASLKRLDLSRDTYDFKMSALMNSLRTVATLQHLVLPRETFRNDLMICARLMRDQGQAFWPPNLSHLQFNETMLEMSPNQWGYLLASLPGSLRMLAFSTCQTYRTFQYILGADVKAPQVEQLLVDVRRGDDAYMLNHLTRPFPNLRQLTIPAMTAWSLEDPVMLIHLMASTSIADPFSDDPAKAGAPTKLQHLVLQPSPDFVLSQHISITHLARFVERCPALLRIDVPEAYLDLESDDGDVDAINDILTQRAASADPATMVIHLDDAGIYTSVVESQGVGLKRSLRYPG